MRTAQTDVQNGKASTPRKLYVERSAVGFQAEELARLQASRNSSSATSTYQPTNKRANSPRDNGRILDKSDSFSTKAEESTMLEREVQFKDLKLRLESALRSKDMESIVDGYKNLGQHFLNGNTPAEHKAAKQMFERALEHATKAKPQMQEKGAADSVKSPVVNSPRPGFAPASPSSRSSRAQNPSVPTGCICLQLRRTLVPGTSPAPDGLCGVGLSFLMSEDGTQRITKLARSGPADSCRQITIGDEIISVDGTPVKGLSSHEIIKLVKGPADTTVTIVLRPDKGAKSRSPALHSRDDAAAAQRALPQLQTKLSRENVVTSQSFAETTSSDEDTSDLSQSELESSKANINSPSMKSSISPDSHYEQAPYPLQLLFPSGVSTQSLKQKPISEAKSRPLSGKNVLEIERVPSTGNSDLEAAARIERVLLQPQSEQAAKQIANIMEESKVITPTAASSPISQFANRKKSLSETQRKNSDISISSSIRDNVSDSVWLTAVNTSDLPRQQPNIQDKSQPGCTPPAIEARTGSPLKQAPDSENCLHPPPLAKKKAKRITLTRVREGSTADAEIGCVGIRLEQVYDSSGSISYFVESVNPGSPAGLCGQIHKGDLLYSVEGTRIKFKHTADVMELLNGRIGSQVTIIVVPQQRETAASSIDNMADRQPSTPTALATVSGKRPSAEMVKRLSFVAFEKDQAPSESTVAEDADVPSESTLSRAVVSPSLLSRESPVSLEVQTEKPKPFAAPPPQATAPGPQELSNLRSAVVLQRVQERRAAFLNGEGQSAGKNRSQSDKPSPTVAVTHNVASNQQSMKTAIVSKSQSADVQDGSDASQGPTARRVFGTQLSSHPKIHVATQSDEKNSEDRREGMPMVEPSVSSRGAAETLLSRRKHPAVEGLDSQDPRVQRELAELRTVIARQTQWSTTILIIVLAMFAPGLVLSWRYSVMCCLIFLACHGLWHCFSRKERR